MKLPWVKWFPSDWLADAELAKTSLLGRGLWIEALNVMFNSSTYALEGTPRDLARVLRCTESEFNTAFEELCKADCACHKARNGIVTLISRRLERIHKKRDCARLRKQRSRKSEACHAKVASASAYASASNQLGKGDIGERGVELPPRFPQSVDDACRIVSGFCPDPTFVTNLWNSAMARNGLDGTGQPIRSWPHYVAKHWPKEQAKRAAVNTPQAQGGALIIVKQKELDRITESLRQIRSTYGDHQTWTREDIEKHRKLAERKKQLKAELGVTV